MPTMIASLFRNRLHYAWIVAAAVFITLLTSAGIRSMPGVLMVPLEKSMGWDRTTISLAASLGIALYGLTGPFAGSLMQHFGIRRMMLCALVLLSVAVALAAMAQTPWQLIASWGVLTGLGTGTLANVLGATVVNRWFRKNRGLVMGILTASVATGQLAFLPALAAIIDAEGWRTATFCAAAVTALVLPIVWLLVPERPSSVGLTAYGSDQPDHIPLRSGHPLAAPFHALLKGSDSPTFWLLFASFFVCGLSTNGLIGTHMIALCVDHGLPEVRAAGLLAAMGILDLFGTTFSGWLSDRYDNRLLLAWYYGLRGLSLLFLPFSDFSVWQLTIFAIFYGLDWIATVPPTVRIATDAFGEQDGPILFGWIAAGHQLGAATAAFGAGVLRSEFDTYLQAFVISGTACVLIALILIGAGIRRRKTIAAAE